MILDAAAIRSKSPDAAFNFYNKLARKMPHFFELFQTLFYIIVVKNNKHFYIGDKYENNSFGKHQKN